MRNEAPIRLLANGLVWSGAVPPGTDPDCPTAVATIAERDGRIVAVGARDDLRRRYPGAEELDFGGRLVTPGLIDCHTHVVYQGNRAGEIARRLAGESYQSIARAGGGILATVNATRAASMQQLVEGALPRVDALLAEGVTTLEI
jgi:imidazolonepropionase